MFPGQIGHVIEGLLKQWETEGEIIRQHCLCEIKSGGIPTTQQKTTQPYWLGGFVMPNKKECQRMPMNIRG